jgi:O-antigen ligase
VAVATIIIFIAARFVVPDLDRIFSGRQHSNLLREGQWMAALKLIELKPLMGVGFRNFQPWSTVIKTQYGYPEPLWEGHAHNNYLEIFAGMGIIGFLPFAIWLFGWLIDSFKRDDMIARLCFPAIIVIIIGGLTQNTMTDGSNVFFFMIIYSLFNLRIIKN